MKGRVMVLRLLAGLAVLILVAACTPMPAPTPVPPTLTVGPPVATPVPPTPVPTATPVPPTPALTPTPAPPNLEALHLKASELAVEQCMACHGDKASEESQDPDYPTAHRVHLTSDLLALGCTDCHRKVDLRQGSAAGLRRQVDVELCASCHSPFSSKMQAEWQNLDCTTCHQDWQEKMAAVTGVNMAAITAENCLACHGGAAWYQEQEVEAQ